jgi:NitT/TauT family transport system permease protein
MWKKWPLLWEHNLVTGGEVIIGFLLSVAIGIPLGVAIVYSKWMERALYPILVASQTVPKVAIAPALVMWFGFGAAPKIIVALLVAFFPVVVNTVVGLWATEAETIYLARSMGARWWEVFLKFRFPRALPTIFGGLKISMALAVVGAVVGEFVGSDKGLGYILVVANGNLDSHLLFAAVFMLTIQGVFFYGLVGVLERFAVPWEQQKMERLSATM